MARSFLFRNRFAVYANPFAKSDEVRGDKEAGPIFCGATDRVDHRADGGFCVWARDVDDPRIAKIDIDLGDEAPNIFEPEFDPEALKAVEPGERLFVDPLCEKTPIN